jgi:ParB/RepB/Spo0J family partition protein
MAQVIEVPVSAIHAGQNDRTEFNEEALRGLADSIAEQGLKQPILLRPAAEGFEIVAGERRFRACRLLGRETVPAFVEPLSDEAAATLMLAENVARQDLNAVDEAKAYSRRMSLYGWSEEECAKRGGVSTKRVRDRLKLLGLRADLQALVVQGILPLRYAQILGSSDLDHPMQMVAFGKLRDNPAPNEVWFRREVGALEAAVAQQDLFGEPIDWTQQPLFDVPEEAGELPLPGEHEPPVLGTTFDELARGHEQFWARAAHRWYAAGHRYKGLRCEGAAAAVRALRMGVSTAQA